MNRIERWINDSPIMPWVVAILLAIAFADAYEILKEVIYG